MARTIEAKAVITASDRTKGAFDTVARRLRKLMSAADMANRDLDRTAIRAGRAARAAAAVRVPRSAGEFASPRGSSFLPVPAFGLGAIGVGALGPAAAPYGGIRAHRRFAETDLALTRIGITADATDEQIKNLNKSVRSLAFESGKSFDEVASGLDSLVAGGMNLPEALPALPAIAKTAQAAGAEVQDMATTTLALSQSLGISTSKMQTAFDLLVTGGKAGKFELRDMARYMASIAPAAAAIGLKGEEGLKRIVAVLQTIRAGTGTTEEAAASIANIFAKMESERTATNFKKFGVDLRKEMAKARKEGRDLLEVFVELTNKATKGDLSKIPQLFPDMEFARGMRALLTFKDLYLDVMKQLEASSGSTMKDFKRVIERPKVAIDRLSESFDRLKESAGKALDSIGASRAMQKVAEIFEGTADYYNKPEAERARIQAERRRRAVLDPHIREVEEKIRQREEAERQRTGPSWWQKLGGVKKIAPLDERLREDPVLRELRQRLFDLKSRRDVRSPDDMPPIFSEREVEQMQEVDRERERGKALSAMTPSNTARKQQRRRGAVPMPRSDPRKAGGVSPDPSFVDNVMELPEPPAQWAPGAQIIDPRALPSREPVRAELTGSAEVKGEAKIEVEVKIEPTGDFLKAVASAKNVAADLRGSLNANGPGSTGISSPDASAPRGASGGW